MANPLLSFDLAFHIEARFQMFRIAAVEAWDEPVDGIVSPGSSSCWATPKIMLLDQF